MRDGDVLYRATLMHKPPKLHYVAFQPKALDTSSFPAYMPFDVFPLLVRVERTGSTGRMWLARPARYDADARRWVETTWRNGDADWKEVRRDDFRRVDADALEDPP